MHNLPPSDEEIAEIVKYCEDAHEAMSENGSLVWNGVMVCSNYYQGWLDAIAWMRGEPVFPPDAYDAKCFQDRNEDEDDEDDEEDEENEDEDDENK